MRPPYRTGITHGWYRGYGNNNIDNTWMIKGGKGERGENGRNVEERKGKRRKRGREERPQRRKIGYREQV